MSEIVIQKIKPVASVVTTNIIICKYDIPDAELIKLTRDLEIDVKNAKNEIDLQMNVIYAVETDDGWRRAIVKFIRTQDKVPVIQLIDWREKPINFCPQMKVRKIRSRLLRDRKPSFFKLMIYGLGTYMFDAEYYLVFDQLFKNQTVTGLFALLEPKPNVVHECYVGDLFYNVKQNVCSFRELLITEGISYPSRVQTDINQRILFARTTFLSRGQVTITATIAPIAPIASCLENEQRTPVAVIGGRVDIFEVIGEGSFGVVMEGFDTYTESAVAVKLFKASLYGQIKNTDAKLEAALIRKASSEFVIPLIDTIEDECGISLVFPLAKSTLDEEIYNENFDANRTKRVISMVLNAVVFIHSQHIVHRDLKPNNILVDRSGVIKICDFGGAVECCTSSFLMEICGTYRFMSPEMLLKIGYTSKTDIWSIGCILAEMALRHPLIRGVSDRMKQLNEIFKVLGTPTHETWNHNWSKFKHHEAQDYEEKFSDPRLVEFVKALLVQNPKDRVTASDALAHEYFRDLVEKTNE